MAQTAAAFPLLQFPVRSLSLQGMRVVRRPSSEESYNSGRSNRLTVIFVSRTWICPLPLRIASVAFVIRLIITWLSMLRSPRIRLPVAGYWSEAQFQDAEMFEQVADFIHDSRQIDGLKHSARASRECDHLPAKICRQLRSVQDPFCAGLYVRVSRVRIPQDFGMTGDHRQQIVEVMCNAACEASK